MLAFFWFVAFFTLCQGNSFLAKNVSALNIQRIINGKPASQGRYPYFASLVFQKSGLGCGGALVSPNWVLSAAHCYEKSDPPVSVVISDFDLSTYQGTERIEVEEIVVHPEYNKRTLEFDFLLLRLSEDSAFNPILLSDAETNVDGEDLTIIGFGDTAGDTDDDTEITRYPRILQKASVQVVDKEVCRENYDTVGWEITDEMICAGGGGSDSCQGDSGGPMLLPGKTADEDTLIGVVSFGYGCGLADYPGVYGNISLAKVWIENVISGGCDTIVCPTMSVRKPSVNCLKKTSQCVCPYGYEMEDGACVSCNSYTCPQNSTQTKQCSKKFKHCQCDDGFKTDKKSKSCLSCDYSCPENSKPKKSCVTSSSDCNCDSGYEMEGDLCVSS